jgi:hypothetical protein
VLRQFPIEAGVSPDFEVDEGRSSAAASRSQWPRWLDRELGPARGGPKQWQDCCGR